MKVESTVLKGVLIIETDCFGDNRGWFTESYNKERFAKYGLDTDFVQDNHSYSTQKGVLRGIHFQNNPKAQSKLVRCTKGKILDVVVDLRKGSDTYKKWIAVELSEQNRKQIFIPKGYGHGFVTLTDNVELQYKVDEYYSKECDRSIKYNDPELGLIGVLKILFYRRRMAMHHILKIAIAILVLKCLLQASMGSLVMMWY